ncbi:PAS domain S-box protein [Natrialbaceae archaeon GCM10025810]|uniref:PAS domain S-box protein n=1 Tax=Halovalidus salilacus TaxID=3075124 RepID=UPI00360A00D7
MTGDESDAGRPIERVVEAIEALERGQYDVDARLEGLFDRDDELPRLADAVDGLAGTLRARERDRRGGEDYRRALHRITSDTSLDGEEKLERLLELGCERLEVENGFLSVVDEETGRFEVRSTAGSDLVEPGTETTLSRTICRKTITSDDILGVYDALDGDWKDDPASEEWGLGCYLGGRITVGSELYGTLCFVDRESREAPFSHAEKAFVDLLTGWVSHVFERRERERELRLKDRAMEAAPVGIAIADCEREGDPIVYANEAFCRLTGRSAVDALGRNWQFPLDGAADPGRLEALREAVEAGESTTMELRATGADGTTFWDRVRVAPVEGPDAVVDVGSGDDGIDADEPTGPSRLVIFHEDVTDRTEARNRLRDRERTLEEYRSFTEDVLDAIDDVFYVLERDGSFRDWNETHSAVTGYDDEELASMNALELFPEEHRDRIEDAIEGVFETGSARVEAPYLTRSGETIPYEFVASRVTDPDGDPLAVGIGRDVSERKRYERALERTSELLTQAEEIASVGGWVLDLRAEPFELIGTDQFHRQLGLSLGADIDVESVVGSYHPDDRERVAEAVGAALESGDPYDVEARLITGDGSARWMRTIGEPVVEDGEVVAFRGSMQDVTERKERERDLERTADLLERVQRIADIGGWELDLRTDPERVLWTDELYRLHDLPPDADPGLEEILSLYHEDDRDRVRETLERALETESDYEFVARLLTESGEVRWLRALGEPIYEGEFTDPAGISAVEREVEGGDESAGADGTEADDRDREPGDLVAYRGSVQDVTEQKEREATLESLHDAARGLLTTESESEIADLAVETAEEILDVDGVCAYVLDSTTNRLEPAAFSAGFAAACDAGSAVDVGGGERSSVLWNAFVTGARTVVDDPSAIGRSPIFGADVETALVVPIGDHGVFSAVTTSRPIGEETRRLVETLVATAEAAFDRLESERALRERDAELEARNRRLERQIAITEIIRSIDQSLIGADGREEIERTVCRRLIEADGIEFAWIGSVDPSGTALDPRSWAGESGAYLDAVSLETAGSAEPAVATARREEPTVANNVVEGLKAEPWRKNALAWGFHSVIAVPLAFEEYTYGVLAVYADEPDAFEELERTVFTELGEGIANAINAIETREALHAETLLELTLEIDDADDFLSRIAADADCRVEYEGLGGHAGERTLLFFSTHGADPDAVTGILEGLVSVTDHRLISAEGPDGRREGDGDEGATCLFEATVTGSTVASRLVRHGGSPRSIRADGAEMELVVDVPTTTDVREFVEMLRDRHAGVGLRSRRHVRRAMHTRRELVASLFDSLTDRQLEVLRTAYFAGYFDWPRESTGEEVAEMLGISQPTVNRHLRLGQGRLLGQLFDRTELAALEG